jgi:hypothetical protein
MTSYQLNKNNSPASAFKSVSHNRKSEHRGNFLSGDCAVTLFLFNITL